MNFKPSKVLISFFHILILFQLGALYAINIDDIKELEEPVKWCRNAEVTMSELLRLTQFHGKVEDFRKMLEEGIRKLVIEYNEAYSQYQPLTLSLLKLVLVISEKVVAYENRTEVAKYLDKKFIYHLSYNMLNVAIQINNSFDLPLYAPFIEMNRACNYPCKGYNYNPIYDGYIESIRSVFNRLYMPAIETLPDSPTLLEEITFYHIPVPEIILILIEWVNDELKKNLFRSEFFCMSRELNIKVNECRGAFATIRTNIENQKLFIDDNYKKKLIPETIRDDMLYANERDKSGIFRIKQECLLTTMLSLLNKDQRHRQTCKYGL